MCALDAPLLKGIETIMSRHTSSVSCALDAPLLKGIETHPVILCRLSDVHWTPRFSRGLKRHPCSLEHPVRALDAPLLKGIETPVDQLPKRVLSALDAPLLKGIETLRHHLATQ